MIPPEVKHKWNSLRLIIYLLVIVVYFSNQTLMELRLDTLAKFTGSWTSFSGFYGVITMILAPFAGHIGASWFSVTVFCIHPFKIIDTANYCNISVEKVILNFESKNESWRNPGLARFTSCWNHTWWFRAIILLITFIAASVKPRRTSTTRDTIGGTKVWSWVIALWGTSRMTFTVHKITWTPGS